jgi:hypothetical protein
MTSVSKSAILFLKFLDRSQLYLQRSIINRNQLIAKVEQETSLANERQMEIQHRLYKPRENTNEFDGKIE